jgi:hypothetical protein
MWRAPVQEERHRAATGVWALPARFTAARPIAAAPQEDIFVALNSLSDIPVASVPWGPGVRHRVARSASAIARVRSDIFV